MNKLSPFKIIWTIPIVFLIHNLEELWLMEEWADAFLKNRNTGFIERLYQFNTVALAMVLLTFAVTFILYLHYRKRNKITLNLTILSISLLCFNSFTHIGQFLFLQKYVPGLLSAVFLMAPLTLYSLYLFVANKIITPKRGIAYFGVSILTMGPIIILFLSIAKLFTK
jgi:hypothetical protein